MFSRRLVSSSCSKRSPLRLKPQRCEEPSRHEDTPNKQLRVSAHAEFLTPSTATPYSSNRQSRFVSTGLRSDEFDRSMFLRAAPDRSVHVDAFASSAAHHEASLLEETRSKLHAEKKKSLNLEHRMMQLERDNLRLRESCDLGWSSAVEVNRAVSSEKEH